MRNFPHTTATAVPLRIATYNVRGCTGGDGVRSEERIASVIASLSVDIAGLQELDLNRSRSQRVDQAARIAEHLGWQGFFHPALKDDDEEYGDAVISRYPLILHRAQELPAEAPWFCRESRGALWVEVRTPDGPCHVINTHLGLGFREGMTQAALLAGDGWLGRVPADEPLILLGDFNSLSWAKPVRLLRKALSSEAAGSSSKLPRLKSPRAFPARFPLLALDHILVNRHLRITKLAAVKNALTRLASDHLPVVAELVQAQGADALTE